MKNLSKDDNPEFTSFTSKMMIGSILAGGLAAYVLLIILAAVANEILK